MAGKAAKPARSAREPADQCAALPWRRGVDGRLEVLLITSRDTGRWVIPKGWPMKGKSPSRAAAREAFEEAGVVGRVAEAPRGAYHYDKTLLGGLQRAVCVQVFDLQVEEERKTWPEMGQREKLWVAPGDAAALVDEPELQRLLAAFAA